MRARRFFFFLLMIVFGAGLGVAYGWWFSPPPYADLKPETLSYDYKADYVLMIAEIYRKDGNLAAALGRLALLENLPAEQVVAQALLTASRLQYAQADLETLAFLASALPKAAPRVSPTAPAENAP